MRRSGPLSDSRGRLIYIALAVADAAWLFAAAATFGSIFALGGSPLSWPLITAITGSAMFVGWVALGVRGDFVTLAMLQGGIGLLVVYVSVGLRTAEGVSGLEWSWLPRLTRGDLEAPSAVAAVLVLLFGIFLWRRGLRMVAEDAPWESLHRTFRWGIAAIGVALITEIVRGQDLGIRIVVFPFFGAALAGMALGRLAEPGVWGAANRIWGRVILGTVAAVLALGLVLGLAGSTFGGGPLRAGGTALAAIRDGLFWLISIPLKYVVMAVFAFFQWLRDLFATNTPPPPPQAAAGESLQQAADKATGAAGSGIIDTIVSIIAWPLVAIVLLLVAYFLIRGLRALRRRAVEGPDSERESIRGDADPRKDLAGLLRRLLPSFRLGGGPGERVLRYPADEPGVTEVFEVYFRYLGAALRRGAALEMHMTPVELMGPMEEALPGAPLSLLTERFNAACYGHEPTAPDTIRELESGLDKAGGQGP